MIISFVILSILLTVISGFSKAICDLSEEADLRFTPAKYWIKSVSWRRKWKNGCVRNGERFWGSSRWLVAFTDAWHLFGLIGRITLISSFILAGYLLSVSLWYLLLVAGLYGMYALTFHLFYNSKFLTRGNK